MRYLTSISLALIVLMALSCTAEPATPTPEILATATPTPTPTPTKTPSYDLGALLLEYMYSPTLSKSDALVIVKNHLGLKPANHTNCLDFLAKSGDLNDLQWEAIFMSSKDNDKSFWKVTVVGAAQTITSGPYIGEYELYEETRSVVALTLPC